MISLKNIPTEAHFELIAIMINYIYKNIRPTACTRTIPKTNMYVICMSLLVQCRSEMNSLFRFWSAC